MSGGSFDYLYCKDAESLISDAMQGDLKRLESMQAALLGMGLLEAALETAQVIGAVKHAAATQAAAESAVESASSTELSSLWRAVEWYVSCDFGVDCLARAVEAYAGSDVLDRERLKQWGRGG